MRNVALFHVYSSPQQTVRSLNRFRYLPVFSTLKRPHKLLPNFFIRNKNGPFSVLTTLFPIPHKERHPAHLCQKGRNIPALTFGIKICCLDTPFTAARQMHLRLSAKAPDCYPLHSAISKKTCISAIVRQNTSPLPRSWLPSASTRRRIGFSLWFDACIRAANFLP